MKPLRIGLLGSGFMGLSHTIAFRAAVPAFGPLPLQPALEVLFDVTDEAARAGAERLGFRRWTTDWHSVVSDPDIDVVDIALPNHLHKEIALAASDCGKHIYSEKPLALDADDALEMTQAAEAAGIKTLVGFNYLKNPMTAVAHEIVAGGEIGSVVHFRATHNEDFLADPQRPFGWRCDRRLAGSGALGDLGSHIIAMAMRLVGELTEVCGQTVTVIAERPTETGGPPQAVTNDDQVQFLARFTGGVTGAFEASRVARGRKLYLTYEVTGTRGSLFFDQERMNELQLYLCDDAAGRRGFRRIQAAPEHADYGAFLPVAGHSIGFNEQKAVEVKELIEAIAYDRPLQPDFRTAWKVCRVVDAVERSAASRRWETVGGSD